ncbi:helix-turn-helix domain-containing protein [Halomonas sp. WWR20]
MSMLLMAKAFSLQVGNASRKLVLLKLADNANDQGECFPSYQHIADQCEMGRSTVKGHIKALADAGYLVIQERKRPGYQSSNAYKLTLDEGQKLGRSKPKRPGKSKGSAADRGQPLSSDVSAADRGVSAADLPSRSTADPITCHSFESVSEPVNEPLAAGADAQAAPSNVVAFRPAEQPRCHIPDDLPGPKNPSKKTYKAWVNYAVTYERRYGAYPLWNAKVAGQFSQLVDRVGADNAPGVASYYLSLNTQFYVTKGHCVGTLLADCESIYTQWVTGRQMTATRARQLDGTQANMSAADEAKALLNTTWKD